MPLAVFGALHTGAALLSGALSAVTIAPSGPPAAAWACEYSQARLARLLSADGGPSLLPRELQEARRRLSVDASARSRATAFRLAEWWGARTVVELRCSLRGSRASVAAARIDLQSGRATSSAEESGSIDELPASVDRLAAKLGAPPHAGAPRPGPRAIARLAEAFSNDDPAGRAAAFERALAEDPESVEIAIFAARAALDASNPEAALRALARPAPGAGPLERERRFVRGVAELRLSRFRQAEATFAALEAEAPSAGALNNLGLARVKLGGASATAGVEALRRAATLSPRSPDIALNTAIAFLARGETSAALFWADGALRLEPGDAEIHLARSIALARAEREEEAKTARAMALAIEPGLAGSDDARSLARLERVLETERAAPPRKEGRSPAERAASALRRASRLLESKRAESALAPLRDVVYENPFEARAHHLLGLAHLELGRLQEARRALSTSLWCREDAEARFDLVRALAAAKDRAAAETEARALQGTPFAARAAKLIDALPRASAPR